MKSASRWFHYTDILWCTVNKTLRKKILCLPKYSIRPLCCIRYAVHSPSYLCDPYLLIIYNAAGNLDSVLSKLGYGLNNRQIEVRFPSEAQQHPLPKCPNRSWGPSRLLYNWYSWPFPRWVVKFCQRQTDYSSPYRSQVKNNRSRTSAPPHAFTARTGTTVLFKW
jgi:hypothetical protein